MAGTDYNSFFTGINDLYSVIALKTRDATVTINSKTPTLEESVEQAWAEYQNGDFISHEDLIKKYGL